MTGDAGTYNCHRCDTSIALAEVIDHLDDHIRTEDQRRAHLTQGDLT